MIHRLIAAAALALGLAAPALAADVLRVGAYPANPPWEFKNEASEFEGFEVDMVRDIARRLGRDLEISDMGFQALFAATASNRIDIAISTISITPERLQNQSFTQGYYDADLGLVTSDSSGVKTLEDMKGKIVGTLAASTGEAWIKANMEQAGFAEVRTYPDQNGLLLDVLAGRVAGAINDELGFQTQARQMKGLTVVQTIPTGDRYGLMMPKGSELLEPVNAAITDMKQDGTMAKIYQQWLGMEPRPDSSTVNVLDLPQ